MVKGIDSAFDHIKLCLVSQAEEVLKWKIGFYFQVINLLENNQAATFCHLLFQQVAYGIFRWQIRYLLLLISHPEGRQNVEDMDEWMTCDLTFFLTVI